MPAQVMLGMMELITLLGRVTLAGAKTLHFVYRGGQIVGVWVVYSSGRRLYRRVKR